MMIKSLSLCPNVFAHAWLLFFIYLIEIRYVGYVDYSPQSWLEEYFFAGTFYVERIWFWFYEMSKIPSKYFLQCVHN